MAVENGGASLQDEAAPSMYIGHHETQRKEPVSKELLARAQYVGYNMLTAPVTTSHFQSRVLATLEEHVQALDEASSLDRVPSPLISPLTPQDTDLTPEDSNSSLIAVISPWIDLGSPDPLIALISRQVFSLEVAYAAFCGINNVLLSGPVSDEGTTQYARAVLEALGFGPYLQLHVLLPMAGELEQDVSADGTHLAELAREQYLAPPEEPSQEEDEAELELYSSWEVWNAIRTLCDYSNRLSIVFSKAHQQYLTRFLRLRFPPWILLSDVGPVPPRLTDASGDVSPEPTPAEAAAKSSDKLENPILHLQYMRHLQQTQPSRPPIERFGQGYQDYLQSPLQPLTDNLESITYEVFEKDPVKYEWYERAVALALKDLREKLGEGTPIVVAVVGAGRGPLVTRVLQASQKTGIEVQCWAVEKNPNAHVLLQRRNATDPLWNSQVTVVKSDMRSWPGPTTKQGEVGKLHIMVSELLGSFADNELSPECLDGVQHVLHREHGINIPQSYSAHFTPIASPKMYSDILGRASTDLNMTVGDKWELPYVVMLHQFDYLSTQLSTAEDPRTPDVKEAWSFSHPISPAVLVQASKRAGGTTDAGGFVGGDGSNEHNARSCKVTFECQDRGICHGLGGYFETVLYASPNGQTVELSTNPVTMEEKSKDMISWFPIFFPLKTPLCVPDGAEMEVSMWRQTDDRKVWYEWIVEVYEQGAGGKRRKVGMSELHSSRKNGCLM
ncbi:hypothetical protein LTR08_009100 [Meristemomyces frigidus]|nr:hypothetical protein LTR08_009100 [Meristemomyces frigidus]